MSTKALREKRAKLAFDAQEIIKKGDQITAEDTAKFDEMMAEVDRLGTLLNRAEQAEKLAAEMQQPIGRLDILDGTEGGQDKAKKLEADRKFYAWMRRGSPELGGAPEQREFMRPFAAATDPQSTSAGVGGEFIPEGFSNQLEWARKMFGGMFQAGCTVIRTATGNPLPWPTVNDTTNEGALLAENTEDTVNQVVTSSKTLNAYKYTSKIVKVSVELMQDSAFDMNAVVARALGERLGRIQNRHLTVGTGTDQPQGIVGASTAGKTAASSSAVTFLELTDLIHSVDPAYRDSARLMFHDDTLLYLRKIVDSENRPLWQPSVREGEPDRIWGKPYTINQHMPVMGSGNKSIIFGDMSLYVIREVLGIQMMRLVERYAEFLQVGFIAFMRMDGELINAGTNPIKHLVHPSP
jgi:HK97 family phage major capsid protein